MKIYLTESQFEVLLNEEILNENISSLKEKVIAGVLTVYMACAMIQGCASMSNEQKKTAIEDIMSLENNVVNYDTVKVSITDPNILNYGNWRVLSDASVITVYSPKNNQTDDRPTETASQYIVDAGNAGAHRIVAMERNFGYENNLHYGDVIYIEGTYKGLQDGIYIIHDVTGPNDQRQNHFDIMTDTTINYGGTYDNGKIKKYAKVYLLSRDNSELHRYIKSKIASDKNKGSVWTNPNYFREPPVYKRIQTSRNKDY